MYHEKSLRLTTTISQSLLYGICDYSECPIEFAFDLVATYLTRAPLYVKTIGQDGLRGPEFRHNVEWFVDTTLWP